MLLLGSVLVLYTLYKEAMLMAKKTSSRKPKNKNKLTFTLTGDAMVAVCKFAKITKRSLEEVSSDAFRILMWVLFEQTFGGTVNARHVNPEENRDLKVLVKDNKTAKKYLAQYRHLVRRHATIVSVQED